MKKTDIILIIIVILIIVVGIFAFGKNDVKEINYELPLTLNEEAGLTEITYSEYQDKIDSGEPFIFIVERTGCSYCVQYMPIAEKFATDYNIPIYYINTDNITQDEFSKLLNSNSYFKKNKDWGTPTTMILVGQTAVDSIPGATDENGLYEFLSEYIELEK